MVPYGPRRKVLPPRATVMAEPYPGEGVSEARIVAVGALTAVQKGEMYALLEASYSNVTRARFDRDLAEKEWVVLGTLSESGRVCGFSTLMRIRATAGSRRILAFYSGDTVVDRAFWAKDTFKGIGVLVRHMLRQAQAEPEREAVWFLVSSTWKSSRLLPLIFRNYAPSPGAPASEGEVQVLTELTRLKFGTKYDAERSIVRFRRPSVYRFDEAEWGKGAPFPNGDEHIALFLDRNSDWRAGDRLASLARLDQANLTPLGRRLARNGTRTSSPAGLADAGSSSLDRCG